jgi:hypothetical protein
VPALFRLTVATFLPRKSYAIFVPDRIFLLIKDLIGRRETSWAFLSEKIPLMILKRRSVGGAPWGIFFNT